MPPLSYFERLTESATLIARHPACAGKPEALDQCRYDVAQLLSSGRITSEQAEGLLEILEEAPESQVPSRVGGTDRRYR
jgi:hypothetical protein